MNIIYKQLMHQESIHDFKEPLLCKIIRKKQCINSFLFETFMLLITHVLI